VVALAELCNVQPKRASDLDLDNSDLGALRSLSAVVWEDLPQNVYNEESVKRRAIKPPALVADYRWT